MIGWLSEAISLFESAQAYFWQAALVFIRVGAMLAIVPAIGEAFVPQRVKLGLACALTIVVTPALTLTPEATLADWGDEGRFGIGPVLIEAGAGLLLGLSLRLMFMALQTAGTIMAQSLSLSQMFNGTGMEPQPILSNMLVLAGIVLFCSLGGLSRAVELIVASYEIMPAGHVPDVGSINEWAVRRSAAVFSLAFTLASPFVLAALLYNLALGVINRAMPVLMVTLIGAPALTLGGMILLALLAAQVLLRWREAILLPLSQPFAG